MVNDGRKITVKVDADPAPYQRGLKTVERDTRTFGQKMKGRFKGLGAGIGGALAGVGSVILGLGASIRSAAEDADQAVMLEDALKRVAGVTDEAAAAVEEWIFQTSIAFGVADSELRPALLRLATATADVDTAQQLLTLAMDISAQTGKPLETVAKALGKAYRGQNGPLEKLTGLTLDAGDNAGAWAKNQDTLNKKFGGAAQTKADTYTGTVDNLSVAFDEIVESLGTQLLPLLEDFIDYLTSPEGKRALAAWIRSVEKLGEFLGEVGDALAWIGDQADKLPSWLRDWLVSPLPFVPKPSTSSYSAAGTALTSARRSSMTAAPSSTYAGTTVVVNGAIDPQQTARAVERVLNRAEVRAGRQRFV